MRRQGLDRLRRRSSLLPRRRRRGRGGSRRGGSGRLQGERPLRPARPLQAEQLGASDGLRRQAVPARPGRPALLQRVGQMKTLAAVLVLLALSPVEGLALSLVEGLALSPVEGLLAAQEVEHTKDSLDTVKAALAKKDAALA